jgi:nucleoside-diphosphate-sugar epimerase
MEHKNHAEEFRQSVEKKMSKNKTVLIFGAAGYIASSLIDVLLSKGYNVAGFDNNFKNTTDTLIPFIRNKRFQFMFGDTTDKEDVKKAYDTFQPDYVFAASALVGFPICKRLKELATLVNINGVRNMVEYSDTAKLIFPSTGSVYKPGQLVCDENAIVDPLSHYGHTKIVGEEIVLSKSNTILHRYGTAMGVSKNNMRVNLLANDLTLQAINNKSITIFESSFIRSFIHVEDIANSIVFSIENFDRMVNNNNKIYNVTNNDINLTKKDLCKLIKFKTGCNITYAEINKDLDQRNYSMNADKIYRLGFKPNIGLEETVDELIKLAPLLSTFDKYR